MEGSNGAPAKHIRGVGWGKCTLPFTVRILGVLFWLLASGRGPPSGDASQPSYPNVAAARSLPAVLYSSAATSRKLREESSTLLRRDNKKKNILSYMWEYPSKHISAAARAAGDALRHMFKRPSGRRNKYDQQSVFPLNGTDVDGIKERGEREIGMVSKQDLPFLRESEQLRLSLKERVRENSVASPLAHPTTDLPATASASSPNLSLIMLPSLPPFGIESPPYHRSPRLPVAYAPPHIPPYWLILDGRHLRGVPYSARENVPSQQMQFLPEGVWTYAPSSQVEAGKTEEARSPVQAPVPQKTIQTRVTLSRSSVRVNLEDIPEPLERLLVFPEEKAFFIDKQAVRVIADAANAVAASAVDYPSQKSRALAAKFSSNQPFYIIPRKSATLFDKFGLMPRRFLGEGSFGVVFEGTSLTGVSFAVKVCVQEIWSPMTRTQVSKVFNECESSEIRVPQLFPPSFDPSTLFYRYRMVVPLLTGHVSHLPPVFPLGENVYGTKVCALYPRATCDVQQLIASVRLPQAVQLELTREMITVVARLHLLGIVHLDIKLGNFLVDYQGRVLLSDFGLAMKKRKSEVMVSCRSGSPAFMSPELIGCLANNKDADAKIALSSKMDAFSLGVTLFLVWCGDLPFSAVGNASSAASLVQALDKTYRDGGHYSYEKCRGGNVPATEIKAVIAELLQVEPEKRATPLDVVRASPPFLRRP